MQVTKQVGFYTVDLEITVLSNGGGYFIAEDLKILSIFENASESNIGLSAYSEVKWLTEYILEEQKYIFKDEFAKQAEDDKAEYASYLADERKEQLLEEAVNSGFNRSWQCAGRKKSAEDQHDDHVEKLEREAQEEEDKY